jgi:hypothetical protein
MTSPDKDAPLYLYKMVIKSSFWVLMLWCKTGNSVIQGMMMKAQIFPPFSSLFA